VQDLIEEVSDMTHVCREIVEESRYGAISNENTL